MVFKYWRLSRIFFNAAVGIAGAQNDPAVETELLKGVEKGGVVAPRVPTWFNGVVCAISIMAQGDLSNALFKGMHGLKGVATAVDSARCVRT